MRLDLLADGRVRLGVWEVRGSGETKEAYSVWVREHPTGAQLRRAFE